MIVAVTGGTGFIGREIVRQLVDRGDEVRVLSRRGASAYCGTTVVRGDIETGIGLRRAFEGADAVIHAAGLAHQHSGAHADRFMAVNADGSSRVVTVAGTVGVRRVILLSSVSVYGGTASTDASDEYAPTNPRTAYGQSKLRGERAATEAAATNGVALRILRLATVFGAGDPGNVARLIRAVHRRRFVQIGDGEVRKSMVHREDAARAAVAAADDVSASLRCFNVVGGSYTLRQIVSTISTALGVSTPPVNIPVSVSRAAALVLRSLPGGAHRADALQRWLSDESYSGRSLQDAYGFRPGKHLKEGLSEEVGWYLANAAT